MVLFAAEQYMSDCVGCALAADWYMSDCVCCAVAAEQYLGDTKALLLRANLLKHDFVQKQGEDGEHGHGRGRGRRGGQGHGGGQGVGGSHATAFLGALGGFGGYPDVA